MNYADIKYNDMLNGPGLRISVFVSGCTHRCEGCFNPSAWSSSYGNKFTHEIQDGIIEYVQSQIDKGRPIHGLSLLGGEPFENLEILSFVRKFRLHFPSLSVWAWSGYTYEQIIKDPRKKALLEACDVLTDGRFEISQKDLTLKWRGSCNQRTIDVKKTIKNNSKQIILYEK